MGGSTDAAVKAGPTAGRRRAAARWTPGLLVAAVVALALIATGCATTGAWTATTPVPSGARSRNESVNDLSCSSPTRCVLTTAHEIAMWDGTAWRATPAPLIGYAKTACAGPDFCLAYPDGRGGGGEEAHHSPLLWNGSAWSVSPDPAGVFTPTSVSVFDLDCGSPTNCVALAWSTYGIAAAVWNGSTWAVATPPESLGTSTEAAVGCGAGTCTVAAEGRPTRAYRWDGTSWSTLAAPGFQTRLSCAGPTFCLIQGLTTDEVVAGDGTSWTAVPSPVAGRDGYGLDQVDCGAPRDCVALLTRYSIEPGPDHLAVRWTGGTGWALIGPAPSPAEPPAIPNESSWQYVSCPTATWCMVATLAESPRGYVPVAAHFDGTTWTGTPVPAPVVTDHTLRALSCASDTSCLALGTTYDEQGPVTDAQVWNGTAWAKVPAPAAALAGDPDVSCPTADFCAAAGLTTPTGDPLLAVRQSGTWRTTPAPPEYATGHGRVDCATATACLATTRNGAPVRWNGTAWAPLAAPGPDAHVYDVACPAADRCVGVGTSLWNGFSVATFFHWDGAAWTSRYAPQVNGANPEFWEISCGAADRCAAVGRALEFPAIAQWDGTEWTDQRGPSGEAGGELARVSCRGTSCGAIGQSYDGSGNVLAVTTDVAARVWQHATPMPGSPNVYPAALSCTTTGCLVAGTGGVANDEIRLPWAARYAFTAPAA